jgi:hypothetical protein
MTTITLDPHPDSPECIRIDATTAPRNALPSDDRPRLASGWKRTADGRMTCTWTLRDATRTRLPDLSPEDSTSGLENCVRSIKDRIAIGVTTAISCGFGSLRGGLGPASEWPRPSFFLVLRLRTCPRPPQSLPLLFPRSCRR